VDSGETDGAGVSSPGGTGDGAGCLAADGGATDDRPAAVVRTGEILLDGVLAEDGRLDEGRVETGPAVAGLPEGGLTRGGRGMDVVFEDCLPGACLFEDGAAGGDALRGGAVRDGAVWDGAVWDGAVDDWTGLRGRMPSGWKVASSPRMVVTSSPRGTCRRRRASGAAVTL